MVKKEFKSSGMDNVNRLCMNDFGILSLLPAVVAVVLAFWSKNVVISLLSAAWVGATILQGFNPITGLYYVFDPLIVEAIADVGHVQVTLFSLLVAATISILRATGSTHAMVGLLKGLAKGRRGGMVTSWLSGLLIFFDDYANCLIVGGSMRGLSDRLRISREKLAYIVDSTAAPIASVALVSTWVAYEVSLIDDGLKAAGQSMDGYGVFIRGMGYRFYSWFTLAFVGMLAITGRDFGAMYKAEVRALAGHPVPPENSSEGGGTRSGEALLKQEDIPQDAPAHLAFVAIVPLLALIVVALGDLWIQGSAAAGPNARLFEILGEADGYVAMLKASIVACSLAVVLAVGSRQLSLKGVTKAGMSGFNDLTEALIILFLAWTLGSTMQELEAAKYVIQVLGDSIWPPLLPTLVFVLAAVISFATGTSFGTMSILMPMVIPLSFGISEDPAIYLGAIGAVLTGACWGDHCSPISDTTVLSSLGCGCDHIAHVQTQLPYALSTGAIAVVFGTLPAGLGVNPWICVLAGLGACYGLILWRGRVPQSPEALAS